METHLINSFTSAAYMTLAVSCFYLGIHHDNMMVYDYSGYYSFEHFTVIIRAGLYSDLHYHSKVYGRYDCTIENCLLTKKSLMFIMATFI